MALYPIVVEMKKLLGQMTTWVDKAEAHAASKGYEPDVLLQARLAPDMFPLVSQFQNACDSAKFAAAFTTGKEPPSHPDTEQTFAGCMGVPGAQLKASVNSFTLRKEP
jgi:hypothetical protein